jgi:predicted dehydrogenase
MTLHRSTIRVALVGAGAMGSLHARVVTQSQDTELACVVDPDAEVGAALAERFRTRWLPELDDFDDCDAVIVATPTSTHLKWGLRALEAQRPTLVEKPLADTVDDVRHLVAVARRSSVPLMCGLLERFNPAVLTLMRIVDQPVHIETVRHSPYAARVVTGVAQDLLIHDVDLVLRLVGRLPSSIDARFAYAHPSSEPGAEDVAEVTCDFDGTVLASLSASRISQRKVRSLVVAELDRLIEVDLVRNDITVYRHVINAALDEDGPGYRQQTVIDIPAVHDAREPLVSQLERFVALTRDEADAADELDTLEPPHLVVDEVARIAATGNAALRPPS